MQVPDAQAEAVEWPTDLIDALRKVAEFSHERFREPDFHLSFPVSADAYIDFHVMRKIF